MIFIANVFPKLQPVKNFLKPLSKKCPFRTLSESQHVKVSQILAKSLLEHIYHVFPSFSVNLIWKMSPLVRGEVLQGFVDTLRADGKYPVQDCQNLQLKIQTHLSEKRKNFTRFSVQFPESTSDFKHFEKKDVGHS